MGCFSTVFKLGLPAKASLRLKNAFSSTGNIILSLVFTRLEWAGTLFVYELWQNFGCNFWTKIMFFSRNLMLHSHIWTPWNYNNDKDLSTWMRQHPCMQLDFWQFSRNADICIISGKLSKIYLLAWLYSNQCEKFLFLLKSMEQICPLNFIQLKPVNMDWRIPMHANGFLTIFQE